MLLPPGIDRLNEFMLGGVVVGCLAVGLFFIRFWRRTADRLFLVFAIAFWTLAANWLALAFIDKDEVRTWLYVVRLVAFVLILAGIIDKNRLRRDERTRPRESA
ncbi:MAG TPA: DUF5985 family protein [Tepidisphaeraceae bacterium]|jgi:hypothetical protein